MKIFLIPKFSESKSGSMSTEAALELLQAAAAEIEEESEVSRKKKITELIK